MDNYHKYPRTAHLPWSPGATSDDIRLPVTAGFQDKEVVVTEKMDGENTSLYNNHTHARSLDSRHHSSRDWLKQWHSTIAHNIPIGWRICGENLFARHSVSYCELESYFYGFSIWNESNECLSWNDTEEWFSIFGIELVPVLYRGQWDEKLVQELVIDTSKCEGYVVRTAEAFRYELFNQHVAKWVRSNHVQSEQHWMHAEIVANGLKESNNEQS